MYTNIRYSTERNSDTGSETIAVNAPYHPALVKRFKQLGGIWRPWASSWVFDSRDVSRVRKALFDVFGTDGEDGAELVTVRVSLRAEYYEERSAFYLGGREIARARSRDGGASLGPGVSIIEGPEPTSGGSMKYWKTVLRPGTELEIKDLPRPSVEQMIAEYADDDDFVITVIETAINRSQLEARRKKLLEDLGEIDKALNERDDRGN